jgi:hypothetical protein
VAPPPLGNSPPRLAGPVTGVGDPGVTTPWVWPSLAMRAPTAQEIGQRFLQHSRYQCSATLQTPQTTFVQLREELYLDLLSTRRLYDALIQRGLGHHVHPRSVHALRSSRQLVARHPQHGSQLRLYLEIEWARVGRSLTVSRAAVSIDGYSWQCVSSPALISAISSAYLPRRR